MKEHVSRWVHNHELSMTHIDCITAVMLKILDGKCKMAEQEKDVMALLYDEVRVRSGNQLGQELHCLIAVARDNLDEAMRNHIYEKRVLAESIISRPVMKKFKAMIRREGLLELN